MNNKKVACVGSGVIGASWAICFALKDLDVVVYDINDEVLSKAKTIIHDNLNILKENNVLDETRLQEVENHIKLTTSMEEAVRGACFIQESAPEHYDVKHQVVKEIEKYCLDDAIIASSTSGLLISEIAKNAKHPERFVGGHPYNPPHLIPLVEITKGEKTDEKYDDFDTIKEELVYTLGYEKQSNILDNLIEKYKLALDHYCLSHIY